MIGSQSNFMLWFLLAAFACIAISHDPLEEEKKDVERARANLDQNIDKELDNLRLEVRKQDKENFIKEPNFLMKALPFRLAIINYMKTKVVLEKKYGFQKMNKVGFKTYFQQLIFEPCQKYLQVMTIPLESLTLAIKYKKNHLHELDKEYPNLTNMLMKKRICEYATEKKFDLPGQIHDLFWNPRKAKKNYKIKN